jgi:predicted nucleic acid-binding protein
MSAPIFVDTNILLYARDATEREKQLVATECLTWLWRERLGRTSTQVLSEYYVNVTRKLKPGLPASQAWDDVTALMAWHPMALDVTVLRRAREIEREWRLGWWDSMIVATAQLQGCATLLTEDLQSGAVIGGVTIRNPFVSALHEPAARYAVAAPVQLAARRHRGPGRPKKQAVMA